LIQDRIPLSDRKHPKDAAIARSDPEPPATGQFSIHTLPQLQPGRHISRSTIAKTRALVPQGRYSIQI